MCAKGVVRLVRVAGRASSIAASISDASARRVSVARALCAGQGGEANIWRKSSTCGVSNDVVRPSAMMKRDRSARQERGSTHKIVSIISPCMTVQDSYAVLHSHFATSCVVSTTRVNSAMAPCRQSTRRTVEGLASDAAICQQQNLQDFGCPRHGSRC